METFLIDVVILGSFFSGPGTSRDVESQRVDLHGWQVELVCQVARDKDPDGVVNQVSPDGDGGEVVDFITPSSNEGE
jgi:hypothetical protein